MMPFPPPAGAVDAIERRLQTGLAALRAVTLVWAFVVAGIDTASGVLARPTPAIAVLTVLTLWSTIWTYGVIGRAGWVRGPGALVDVLLAMVAAGTDPLVYPGSRPQSFASAWPLTAVLATGVVAGPPTGLAAGLAVGAAGAAGAALDGAVAGRVLALGGSAVLLGAAGWVAGWVAAQLRSTTEAAASAEARAEVARTLHDGVLQTLAVVQRRSDDPDLVDLARVQDTELRAFLRGSGERPGAAPASDVPTLLGPALNGVERRFGTPVHLVVVDPGSAAGPAAAALAGAATEAATNAAKHSGAPAIWVSVDLGEPSGTLVVVHDEGTGFEPVSTPEGDGMTGSVRGRIAEVGGTVDVRSAPGAGCEVRLWVP